MSRKAVELFEKFNNKRFSGFREININFDSKKLVDLGRCLAVCYASKKTGKPERFKHDFGTGARLLASEDGRTLIIIGEKIRTTDWIRG